MISDFELAASVRAATLTIHARQEATVEPRGEGVTIEHRERRDAGSPNRATMETCLDVGVTKVVRGVLSAPGSPV